IALFRRSDRLSRAWASSRSAEDKRMWDGTMSRFGYFVFLTMVDRGARLIRELYSDSSRSISIFGWIKTRVVFVWGSVSIRSIFRPSKASPAARLIAVVLFATPPF